jgi:endonuclease/exonuclease/phosphatase (EEP) superfamily protein YafD
MRKSAHWLLVGVATLLILLSFLPAWETDRWWVRQWDYPRLQVAGLILLVGAALWFVNVKRDRGFWLLLVGLVAALAWQASHFSAYLPLHPKEVASSQVCPAARQVSMLNANVLMTNRRYQSLLAVVAERKPDVLLLLEPDQGWQAAIAPLASAYRYRLSEPVPNTYGMILLSRLPMQGAIQHRVQAGVPSAKVLLTLPGGQQIMLHALHPEPPWPGDDSGERDAELVMVGREVRNDGRAAVVMGDLNDVAWSRTSRLFKKVAGMHDPRVGRGFYPTFNANYRLLRWPLDHLFVSPHFKMIQIDRLGGIGSDHFPIFFRLCLEAQARARAVAPSASAETEAQANNEVAEGKQERAEENRGQ